MQGIEHAKVFALKDQIDYQDGKVASKQLAENAGLRSVLFAFDKGQGLETHKAGGDAFVTVVEGTGEFTIDGVKYTVPENHSIIMPKGHPHSVHAVDGRFKMLLMVVLY